MATLEQARAAARPHPRHAPKSQLLSLFCTRCERPYKTVTLSRECFPCEPAAVKAFGTTHPPMEMSG